MPNPGRHQYRSIIFFVETDDAGAFVCVDPGIAIRGKFFLFSTFSISTHQVDGGSRHWVFVIHNICIRSTDVVICHSVACLLLYASYT